MEHVLLKVEVTESGKVITEPVHVDRLANGRLRLVHSPGLVLGIAAGDEFTLADESGTFEVVKRGGNLAIQVFSGQMASHLAVLEGIAGSLGGVLDGNVEKGAVFTIPLKATFSAIERAFNEYCAENPEVEWYYGNVYSPEDGITPLRWWDNV